MLTKSTNYQVRTVDQVRKLDRAIARCDRKLDRAVSQGHLEASIKYEAKLAQLTNAMASVGDALWGKYCNALMQEEA